MAVAANAITHSRKKGRAQGDGLLYFNVVNAGLEVLVVVNEMPTSRSSTMTSDANIDNDTDDIDDNDEHKMTTLAQ